MACQVCGKPSGFYPLCPACFRLKDEGKIVKCAKCEKWHRVDEACDCPVCQKYSRAYLRHLLKSGEMLGMRFAVMHNLYFYNRLMADIRCALEEDRFETFYEQKREIYGRRI